MSKDYRYAVLIWVLLISGSVACSGEDLDIAVETSKDRYTLGDFVDLCVDIKNRSLFTAAPITIGNVFIEQAVQIYIAEENTEPTHYYWHPGWVNRWDSRQERLKFGAVRRTCTQVLTEPDYDARLGGKFRYVFWKAATYTVRVKMRREGGVYQGETTIVVQEPTGKKAEYWNIIRSDPDLGRYLQLNDPDAIRNPVYVTEKLRQLQPLVGNDLDPEVGKAIQSLTVKMAQ